MPYYTAHISERRSVHVRYFWDGDEDDAMDAWENGEVEEADVLSTWDIAADCVDIELSDDQTTPVKGNA